MSKDIRNKNSGSYGNVKNGNITIKTNRSNFQFVNLNQNYNMSKFDLNETDTGNIIDGTRLENRFKRMLVTIYVDSTNGNDSNNGLTPGEAIKTLSQAQSMSTTYTNFAFKRGETFNGKMVVTDVNIFDYGDPSDNMPYFTNDGDCCIDGSNVSISNIHAYATNTTGSTSTILLSGQSIINYSLVYGDDNKAILVHGANGTIIDRCVLINGAAQVITLFQSQNCTISNCVIIAEDGAGVTNGIFIHGAGSSGHKIIKNRITKEPSSEVAAFQRAIYISSDIGTPATPMLIKANMIEGRWQYDMEFAGPKSNVLLNVINVNKYSNGINIYINSTTNIRFVSNSIYTIDDGGTPIGISVFDDSSNYLRNNVYDMQGSDDLGNQIAANGSYQSIGNNVDADYTIGHDSRRGFNNNANWNLQTLSAWRTTSGKDSNSVDFQVGTYPATQDLWKDEDNGDFSPAIGSPLISSGVYVDEVDGVNFNERLVPGSFWPSVDGARNYIEGDLYFVDKSSNPSIGAFSEG